MDNLNQMDSLGDAIAAAWDDGTLRGAERSEPTGRALNDPMAAAADIAAYEIAREHSPEAEARARQSGDVDLAAQAVERVEDEGYELDMIRHDISEELWQDPEFAGYVADAEGDVEEAARRWDAERDEQIAQAEAVEAQQFDSYMGQIVDAVNAGQLDFYSLPPEVQATVAEWAEGEQALAEVQAGENAYAADQLAQAQQLVDYGATVAELGGNVHVFEQLIAEGYDIETAANAVLASAPTDMDTATAALERDVQGDPYAEWLRSLADGRA